MFGKIKVTVFAGVIACAIAALAAPKKAAEPTAGFDKVSKEALKALKATVGKPFSKGMVFIDGHYIDTPYKVERYGTVIRINGVQVTDEVVSWGSFLRTQPGLKMEKVEIPAVTREEEYEEEVEVEEEYEVGDGPLIEKLPRPKQAVAKDAAEVKKLFEDRPGDDKPLVRIAKPNANGKAVRKVKKTVTKTRTIVVKPARTEMVCNEKFEFKPNDKSKELLEKINKYRTDIDKRLRVGSILCFSSNYSMVAGDAQIAQYSLETLPALLKDNTSYERFAAAARAKNLVFFGDNVLKDIFRNRADYLVLEKRLNRKAEDADLQELMEAIK